LLDAAPEKSLRGTGPVLVTGVRVQGLAMLGGLFKNLKQAKSEMKMDRLEGTVAFMDGKAVLDLKSEGETGRTRVKGSVGFDGVYAPEMRVENDVKKEALDVDAYFGSLPESLRKKLDINRAADAQGYVPVDFKLTGPASEVPGAKALDLARLTKNVTSSYTKGVLEKVTGKSGAVSTTVQKAGEALGGKLKGLFGK
jgi:hypothetical protein